MTRAKKIITAFQLLGLLGFFVILSAANEAASMDVNLSTLATGLFMMLVSWMACVYIRSLRRKR